MDLFRRIAVDAGVFERFERGQSLEALATELKVPLESLRPHYDRFRMKDLEGRILARPSFQRRQRHRAIGKALGILLGNSKELLGMIGEYESGAFFEGNGNLGLSKDFYTAVARLFHNYLASATTIVGHVSRCARRSAFRKSRKEECDGHFAVSFKNNELAAFVAYLRNRTVHEELALQMTSRAFGPGGSQIGPLQVYVDATAKERMQEPERLYYERHGDRVDVRVMVEAYDRHIQEFIRWFIENDLQEIDKIDPGMDVDAQQLQALAHECGIVTNLPLLAAGFRVPLVSP